MLNRKVRIVTVAHEGRSANVHMSSEPRLGTSLSSTHIPELVTLEQLAERWQLPLSWLRENCRSRCADPLPVYRCGRYVRVDLSDSALAQWLNRRRVAGRMK
jgi:hypothetical protein